MAVLLRSKYSAGLEHFPTAPDQVSFAMPSQKLVEHLVSFYLRGVLPIDDDLIQKLFGQNVPVEIRSYAIEFVGRVLRSDQELPEEFVPRAVRLWEWRRDSAAEQADPMELLSFGWWVGSGRLPATWELVELEHVLRLTRGVEPDHLVVEHLATLGVEHAGTALACLTVLIENPSEPWSIYSWRESAAQILGTAFGSQDSQVRQAAEDLANRLVALGFDGFEELITTHTD